MTETPYEPNNIVRVTKVIIAWLKVEPHGFLVAIFALIALIGMIMVLVPD